MKDNKYSQPYRNLGFGKIESPKTQKIKVPKVTRVKGTDLRVGGKRK